MAQPQANHPTRGSTSTAGRPAMAVSTATSLLELYWLRSSCMTAPDMLMCPDSTAAGYNKKPYIRDAESQCTYVPSAGLS